MARRYQARPKPIILQKGDAGIRIILDSNALIPLFQRGNFFFMTQTPPFDELRAGFWKRGERGDLCAEGAGNNAMDLRAGMLDRYRL
jgi:hypothetical protein